MIKPPLASNATIIILLVFISRHHIVQSFNIQRSSSITKKPYLQKKIQKQKHYDSSLRQQQTEYFTTSSSDAYQDKSNYPPSSISMSPPSSSQQKLTLSRYLHGIAKKKPELREMESFGLSIQMACKTIANMVNRNGINRLSNDDNTSSSSSSDNNDDDSRLNSMKRLDEISTNVLRNALRYTGKMTMIKEPAQTSSSDSSHHHDKPREHQPGVLIARDRESKYVGVFDPLDGSGNADAAICTGTIFGIFEQQQTIEGCCDEDDDELGHDDNEEIEKEAEEINVLLPGKNLRAAGYCLYSSTTMMVFSLGDGVVMGFTLDPQLGEFVLTHKNIRIPKRGSVYSCNEANAIGWNDQLLTYLQKLKSGDNESQKRYVHRYIGSLVADIHRTLMYGGIFWYPGDTVGHPRGNLQLLYKSMPLASLVEQAGGMCTNGRIPLMEVKPETVHERSPCFMGSVEDMKEMMKYVRHDDDDDAIGGDAGDDDDD